MGKRRHEHCFQYQIQVRGGLEMSHPKSGPESVTTLRFFVYKGTLLRIGLTYNLDLTYNWYEIRCNIYLYIIKTFLNFTNNTLTMQKFMITRQLENKYPHLKKFIDHEGIGGRHLHQARSRAEDNVLLESGMITQVKTKDIKGGQLIISRVYASDHRNQPLKKRYEQVSLYMPEE